MKKKKKGSAFIETITWGVALLAFSVAIVLVLMVINNFSSSIQDDPDVPDGVKAWTAEQETHYVSYMDYVFAFFVFLTWVAAIMLALDIESSPLFGWISFGLGIFSIAFLVIVKETYGDFTTSAGIGQFAAQFPKMLYVMNNLPLLGVGFLVTVLIAYFAKPS